MCLNFTLAFLGFIKRSLEPLMCFCYVAIQWTEMGTLTSKLMTKQAKIKCNKHVHNNNWMRWVLEKAAMNRGISKISPSLMLCMSSDKRSGPLGKTSHPACARFSYQPLSRFSQTALLKIALIVLKTGYLSRRVFGFQSNSLIHVGKLRTILYAIDECQPPRNCQFRTTIQK